jgi:hypothetical protein
MIRACFGQTVLANVNINPFGALRPRIKLLLGYALAVGVGDYCDHGLYPCRLITGQTASVLSGQLLA